MESEKLIYKKIIAVLKDIKAIGKKQSNENLNYQFMGLDDITNALHPLFQKHTIFIIPEVISQTTNTKNLNETLLLWTSVNVKFTFYTEDGSNVVATMQGEATDAGDKSTSKAISIALRNTLKQMFLIPTLDPAPAENNNNKTHALPNPPTNELPWMSGSVLKRLLERIEKGEKELFVKAIKTYRIKNTYYRELEQAERKQIMERKFQ